MTDSSDNEKARRGSAVEKAWACPVEQVISDLEVDIQRGLDEKQVRGRRREYGPNRLQESSARPWWRILYEQFKSVVVLILAASALLSLVSGNLPEGVAILLVLAVNTGIGFFSEWRATRSMEELHKIGRPEATVRRGGEQRQVSVTTLVPGDVCILEGGDGVPADLRVVAAEGLMVDESTLTGESVAVAKQVDEVDGDVPLAERSSMAFKGTTIVDGRGEGVVVATGMGTELGRVTELAGEVEGAMTPLERKLEHLGRRMAVLVLIAAALTAAAGVWAGQPVRLIVATSIALGVAAVPEGLPIVANLALARGMWVMARHNALINRLPAVETLGSTDVIFTDKTGTLTENRMTVRRYETSGEQAEPEDDGPWDPGSERVARAVEVGVLCSNASLDGDEDGKPTGDPTEVALLRAGRRMGLDREELLERKPEVREESFDPAVMMMATFHRGPEGLEVAVKGAASSVVDACTSQATGDNSQEPLDEDRQGQWKQRARELAAEGLRVLALADKRVDDEQADAYEDLRLLGLVGMEDPAREGVGDLVASCHEAGVLVVMVTGDQSETARAIAEEVGIVDSREAGVIGGGDLGDPDELSEDRRREVLETRVFARFSPEQKLDVVDLYQRDGHRVAMTGDGINDAPALKKADIGVAMGQRGTPAAQEVADMVLQDDRFSSIVSAIRQGRTIFTNIRKAVMFILCTNIAEVLAVTVASVAGLPVPLLPLQILYLNVLTDALPALALGVGDSPEGIMKRDPRRGGEAIMTWKHWACLSGWGVIIAGCVLAALLVSLHWLGVDRYTATTVSFISLGFMKLWFVYNLRDRGAKLLNNQVLRNPWIWAAVGFCSLLLVAAVYLPGLSDLLNTRPLGLVEWAVVLVASIGPVVLGQAVRPLYPEGRRGD